MQKTAIDWVIGNPVTAAHLNQFGTDLNRLFSRVSSEDIETTYDASGQLTQLVDNENSITINMDWSHITDLVPILYIQEVGDPKKYTITYGGDGYLASILYS